MIESGDLDAIRELLPKPNLFGRWATHLELGRGIIINTYPDELGTVWFAIGKGEDHSGDRREWVHLDNLTLDPVELTTLEDFENAPAGTIVANNGDSPYTKRGLGDWADRFDEKRSNEGMSGTSRKVLRWGWGETNA